MRFWVHQALEYLLAALLMSQALQSPKPVILGTPGIVLLVLAASADGPLRAVGPLSRPVHRVLDIAAVIGLVASAAVFWSALDFVGVILLLGAAVALVVLIVRTDYRPKPARVARSAGTSSISSEEVGRRAGRLVGNGVRAWRGRRGPTGNDGR